MDSFTYKYIIRFFFPTVRFGLRTVQNGEHRSGHVGEPLQTVVHTGATQATGQERFRDLPEARRHGRAHDKCGPAVRGGRMIKRPREVNVKDARTSGGVANRRPSLGRTYTERRPARQKSNFPFRFERQV